MPSAGAPGPAIMESPRLAEPHQFSAIEIDIIPMAYARGFRDGTSKQDFIVRGLIKAQ